ncbi:GGDEF domain-containing protein [Micromonospora sp. WMMD723]|uniref:GGDEF domain-containing protein n=1 Tax=Micromonospora sp. WMMD723 TaxID=3403465 RepID=UPI003CF11BF2
MPRSATLALLFSTSCCCLLLIAYSLRLRGHLAAARHEARHDELTGLPNRRAMLAHLDHVLSNPAHRVAVLLLDLDRFKDVNDEYGHAAGDFVLRHVAVALVRAAPPRTIVGRMSGDEFLIIVDGDADTARSCAQAAANALANATITLRWQPFHCHASIGLAAAGPGHRTPTELLAQADAAMYAAKQAGGGVREYHPDLTDLSTRTDNDRRRFR